VKFHLLYNCLGFILLFTSCVQQTEKQKLNDNSSKEDSLKVFFFNLQKNQLDSLSQEISDEIMTTRGLDVKKLFMNISDKDSLGYEYYANFAYLQALKYKRYSEALKYLDLGAYKATDKSRYYFDKACMWAYIQPLKQRDTVYKYLKLAINNDSLNAFYYSARSQFRDEDGLVNLAMLDINTAIKLDSEDTSYINCRGTYKIELQDWSGALKDLENVGLRNINNAYVYMYRAMAYNKFHKHKEALEESNKCLGLDSTIAIAYLIRGNAKFQLGNKDEGIVDITKAAKLGDEKAQQVLNEYQQSKSKKYSK
jgi:hypothetical protein